ncbi:uncharacterized protein LOC143217148 [Lasioglossum baleicum]|uniref:uncharacterized protein LOC143217148 n=1 Tax=Lasioglossum baleicum TaxID=434251 RepID=UPI003FCD6F65
MQRGVCMHAVEHEAGRTCSGKRARLANESGQECTGRVDYGLQRVSQSSRRYHVWITHSSSRKKRHEEKEKKSRSRSCATPARSSTLMVAHLHTAEHQSRADRHKRRTESTPPGGEHSRSVARSNRCGCFARYTPEPARILLGTPGLILSSVYIYIGAAHT